MFTCDNTYHADNPVLGKWKSLWIGSPDKSFDFNVSFESNNTFHIEVFGGEQTKPMTIFGNYKVNRDTFIVLDKISEPHVCNYTDTGRYTFIERNDTLFFKVIRDLCERRKLTLEKGLIKPNDVAKQKR